MDWQQFVSKKFSVCQDKLESPPLGPSAPSEQINFHSMVIWHLVAFMVGLGNLRLKQILEEKHISGHFTWFNNTLVRRLTWSEIEGGDIDSDMLIFSLE